MPRKTKATPAEGPKLTAPGSRMAAGLLSATVEELNRMSGSWKQLSKEQQDSVIDRLRSKLDELVDEAVIAIQAGSFTRVAVKVGDIAVKKDVYAKVLIIDKLHSVIEHHGKKAVLVLVDPETFKDGLGEIEGEDDQRSLDVGNEASPGD